MPFIWSAFFFVLTCNLLGMIPLADWTPFIGGGHVIGGTATANIWVTATLAVSTLFMIVYNGLRLHGFAYIKHFFMGPPGINVVIAGLELIGLVAKTFALAVRLFANMVAGHVMLAVIVGFVGAATAVNAIAAVGISIPVILGAVALNFLEIFVAFLQAFIFTFLSAMFIGQAVNIHHDEHDEAHAVAEAPSAAVEEES
jgi:F-type H+-transporting ATPase subunit a